jgi:hypothetical protein
MFYYKWIKFKNKIYEKQIAKAKPVYLVVQWARWCVLECKWTGGWVVDLPECKIAPEIFKFTDHNGEFDQWYKCSIYDATSSCNFSWTFDKEEAERIAENLNSKGK